MERIGSEFIKLIQPVSRLEDLNKSESTEKTEGSFFDIFQNAYGNVKETRQNYTDEQYLLATGQTDDPHNVMIAASKAELSVELLVQLRNKSLEAYDQLIRTSF